MQYPRLARSVLILLALLLLGSGCAAGKQAQPAPASPASAVRFATLMVENQGIDSYTIRIDGQRVGWVMAGQTECLRLPTYLLHREVRVTAEHQHGQIAFSSSFHPGQRKGWQWRLGVLRSVGSFPVPIERPCLARGSPLGFANWNDDWEHAEGWIRLDILWSEELWAVAEHEYTHIRQSERLGRELWIAALKSRAAWMQMEAEAFCASARVALREQRFPTLEQAIHHYARALAEGYPFGLSVLDAAAEIRRFCSG